MNGRSNFGNSIILKATSILIVLVGCFVMLGWAFDVSLLKSVFSGFATMKPNTALCFILCGISLWFSEKNLLSNDYDKRISQACAVLILIIGLVTLAEYIFHLHVGIDQILFSRQILAEGSEFPGRMSPVTAFNFFVLGIALFLQKTKKRSAHYLSQWLSLVIALTSLIIIVGYTYNVRSVYRIAPFASIAIHTAISFFAVSLCLLFADKNKGITAGFFRDSVGGILIRRLVPAAILIPFFLGWLRLKGEYAGYYDTEFGLALFATSNIIIFTFLVWRTAFRLDEIDAARQSAQENLNESIAEITRLASIVESSEDAIISKDFNGVVLSWNKGAERMFGYTAEEIIGQNITILFPPELLAEEEVILARIKSGKHIQHYETIRKRKDGLTIEISLSISPIKNERGEIIGASKIARDITEQKRVEEEIVRLNESLEQKVAERTTELNAVNKELEAFSYSVSHDLRAPLRAMDGFSLALLEDYAEKLDATGQNFLNRVRNASQQMARLIDDMLLLSRVTRSELIKTDVNLSEIVKSIAEKLQENQPREDVYFEIEENVYAYGDGRLLKIALENLLGNAYKFTSKCSETRIIFGQKQNEKEHVYFVKDNGAGFDMAYADKLFGAFQRLHSSTEFEGTGIGLATVQRVIRRHGGQIRAEGNLGKGASFYFTL